jgi:hypothetical protein
MMKSIILYKNYIQKNSIDFSIFKMDKRGVDGLRPPLWGLWAQWSAGEHPQAPRLSYGCPRSSSTQKTLSWCASWLRQEDDGRLTSGTDWRTAWNRSRSLLSPTAARMTSPGHDVIHFRGKPSNSHLPVSQGNGRWEGEGSWGKGLSKTKICSEKNILASDRFLYNVK